MKNVKLYALVAALTLGNIGLRVASAEQGAAPRLVSHLERGDRVESPQLEELVASADVDVEACRMVVAFNPDCPFCEAAAERERLTAREGTYGRTLWITDADRARLPTFAADLAEGSRYAVAPEAFEALDVDAVPALFMIDGSGTVHWVGPYGGGESSEELARRCTDPTGSQARTLDVTTVAGG